MKMQTDKKMLEQSLKKASKAFGESTEQSTFRWGVQIARDLAGYTQAFGRGKQAKEKQIGAIWRDALNVCIQVKESEKAQLNSEAEAIAWINQHRTRRGKRTAVLPENKRKSIKRSMLETVIVRKSERVGSAKGAWIGAGQDIARKQIGMKKIAIGKNFLGYAQKFASEGRAIVKKKIFDTDATLANSIEHTANPYVLRDNQKQKAVNSALNRTIKWYEKAATAKLK
jgi:hypothetical protein